MLALWGARSLLFKDLAHTGSSLGVFGPNCKIVGLLVRLALLSLVGLYINCLVRLVSRMGNGFLTAVGSGTLV